MSDKPASIYREVTNPACTRRKYITDIPGLKIAQHDMGDLQADPEGYPVQISLKVEEEVQIRHRSLESARLSANRLMLKHTGKKQYKIVLRKFPHHVVRENEQATGTGADRVSDGICQSLGKVVGTTARIPKGETVSAAYCDVKDVEMTKDALRRAHNKMLPSYRIVVDRDEELPVV